MPVSYPFPYGYQIPDPSQMMQMRYPYTQQPVQNIVMFTQGGEQSMKSCQISPNQRLFMFDKDENLLGIKAMDASGMPTPLELYDLTRRGNQEVRTQERPNQTQIDTSSFVTRDEMERRLSEMLDLMSDIDSKRKGGETHNGK